MELYLNDTINFGKHKGTKVQDLPHDYIQWLREKTIHTVVEENRVHEWVIIGNKVGVTKSSDGVTITCGGGKFYTSTKEAQELTKKLISLFPTL